MKSVEKYSFDNSKKPPSFISADYNDKTGRAIISIRQNYSFCSVNNPVDKGIGEWEFFISKDEAGKEGILIGASSASTNYNPKGSKLDNPESDCMYLLHSDGTAYNRGRGEMSSGTVAFKQGKRVKVVADLEKNTISFYVDDNPKEIMTFKNVNEKKLFPCVMFYGPGRGEYPILTYIHTFWCIFPYERMKRNYSLGGHYFPFFR